ncbi:type VI secretion system baseplate subunit TssF [Enterobacter hormaechei]|uniref:type VI secretion system baseplate subunit TssF n=1 Tax=Enterobacter hormaechei TaxID=158836 RepID=UPI000DCE02E9|nr:type VI secretion system baseplate subunit TssF [Enterobacter hormaechei]MEA1201881.1 type VI secretion system baseplate subunit TssF [Enterobacter hormaechei]RAY90096.1 type VI secretion system baseplate subunit TssF [Enterobacter hormaechei subsp. steigerwaltii]
MAMEERYFREELDYIRQLGKVLAKEKPHLARFLAEKGTDPDVERMLEGFAFLSGNLRAKIEDEFPELTHSLLSTLCPNYLRPTPSMTIIEYAPDINTITTPVKVDRGEQVKSLPVLMDSDDEVYSDNDRDLPPACTFTLSRDVWLQPLRVASVVNNSSHKLGMIDITFATNKKISLASLELNKIRFWLGNDDDYTRWQLYLWLCRYLCQAELVINDTTMALPDFHLTPVGFDKQDALLPYPKNVYSGYRILQEYLCYPDSFLFFDVSGIPALPAELTAEQITLRLHFSLPLPVDSKIRENSFRLFCSPAVNLFVHHAEVIAPEGGRIEYPLYASHKRPDCYDIFAVRQVSSQVRSVSKGGVEPVVREYPEFNGFRHQVEYARKREVVYYQHRKKTSLFHQGFDHVIAFVLADGNSPEAYLLKDEVASVSLICTSRDQPAKLQPGDVCIPAGKKTAAAPFRNVTKPSAPLWPVQDGNLHWTLLSCMNLNYLSLLDLDTLKKILHIFDLPGIHHPQSARLSQQKLDAIEDIETRPVDHLFEGVPVRGLATTLYINPAPFVCEGEIFLLGTMLSFFFSLYASVNSFHELSIVNTRTQESYTWTDRTGQHALM